jgi:hypothetical protein
VIPVAAFQAKALPYTGMVRSELTVTTSYRKLVILTNSGVSGTVGYIREKAAGAAPVILTIPTLSLSDTAGGPTSGRAMKLGFSVVNNTPDLTAGGRVYYLNSDQRTLLGSSLSTLSDANFDVICNKLMAHPDCISMSGKSLQKTTHFFSHVVDSVDYERFGEWVGTETADEFGAHVCVWSGGVPSTRPMSTLYLLFDEPAGDQSYTLSVRAAFYNRWPLDSLGGQLMRPVPLAPQLAISSVQQSSVVRGGSTR